MQRVGVTPVQFLALWRSLDRAECRARTALRRMQIDYLRAALAGFRGAYLRRMEWEDLGLPPHAHQNLPQRVLSAILAARPRAARRGLVFSCAFPRHLWRTICQEARVPHAPISTTRPSGGTRGSQLTTVQALRDFVKSRGRLAVPAGSFD